MSGGFRVGESMLGSVAEHGLESTVVVRLAKVEREHALVEVAEQVERLHADVGDAEPVSGE